MTELTLIAGSEDPALFLPYGLLPTEFVAMPGYSRVPKVWHGPDYDAWIADATNLIAYLLWPRYDARTHEWQGAARDRMAALTRLDFKLFPALQSRFEEPAWPGALVLHQDLFKLEDTSDIKNAAGKILLDRSLDATLSIYLGCLSATSGEQDLVTNYLDRLMGYSGNIDLDIKAEIQRPRAYQMARVFGIDFAYHLATSAASPSMISGHCFQTMMGGVGSFYAALNAGASSATLGKLAQHTVDVGDRRVFAGVHYPSDNLSSWIVGMLAQRHLCPDDAGQKWLWEAITTRSAVYRAVAAELDSGEAQPYRPAWAFLHAIGTARWDEIDGILARALAEMSEAA